MRIGTPAAAHLRVQTGRMNRSGHSVAKVVVLTGVLIATLGTSNTAPAHASLRLVEGSAQESTWSHWVWPVPPPHSITRGFQAPATRYSAGHRGIDIAAVAGEPLSAPADAVVHFSGRVVDRPVLTLETDDGLLISFEPVESSVPAGTRVGKGDVIATSARGGHCDAACVHLGVRRDGEYLNPLLFLGGLVRAVLLPLS